LTDNAQIGIALPDSGLGGAQIEIAAQRGFHQRIQFFGAEAAPPAGIGPVRWCGGGGGKAAGQGDARTGPRHRGAARGTQYSKAQQATTGRRGRLHAAQYTFFDPA
jgi:hypothetical protein